METDRTHDFASKHGPVILIVAIVLGVHFTMISGFNLYWELIKTEIMALVVVYYMWQEIGLLKDYIGMLKSTIGLILLSGIIGIVLCYILDIPFTLLVALPTLETFVPGVMLLHAFVLGLLQYATFCFVYWRLT